VLLLDVWNRHSHWFPYRSNAPPDIPDSVLTRPRSTYASICFAFSSDHLSFLVDTTYRVRFQNNLTGLYFKITDCAVFQACLGRSGYTWGDVNRQICWHCDQPYPQHLSTWRLAVFIIRLYWGNNIIDEPAKGTAASQQRSRSESAGKPRTVVGSLWAEEAKGLPVDPYARIRGHSGQANVKYDKEDDESSAPLSLWCKPGGLAPTDSEKVGGRLQAQFQPVKIRRYWQWLKYLQRRCEHMRLLLKMNPTPLRSGSPMVNGYEVATHVHWHDWILNQDRSTVLSGQLY
jgi:hypothetical protein